jgi:ABC-type transport system involved in cytochrome c biogenesis permease subunit
MTLSEWSYTAMVTAAVLYLVAFALHALEWSSARGLAETRPEDGSEDAARVRVDFGAIVLRGVAAHRAPWGNMYEFITTSLGFAALIYLFCAFRFGMRWLGLGVTLILTIGLGLAVTQFYVDVAPLMPALHSVWFIFHIVAACIAGAAFNVGAIAAILYLIRERAERRAAAGGKELTGYVAKLPSSARLDLFSYRMHAFGVPLWTFVIVAGSTRGAGSGTGTRRRRGRSSRGSSTSPTCTRAPPRDGAAAPSPSSPSSASSRSGSTSSG